MKPPFKISRLTESSPDLGIFAVSYKLLPSIGIQSPLIGAISSAALTCATSYSQLSNPPSITISSRKPSIHTPLIHLLAQRQAAHGSPLATFRLRLRHNLRRHRCPPHPVASCSSSSGNLPVSLPAQARSKNPKDKLTCQHDHSLPFQ